jgi:hypothetical protein
MLVKIQGKAVFLGKTVFRKNSPAIVIDLRETPLRQMALEKSSLDYIFDLNIGDSFEFALFEELVNFSISSKRTKEDGTLTVLATRENMGTFYIYLQKDPLTDSIKFNAANALEGNIYKYHSLNQQNPQLKEWNRDSFIQICK